MPSDCSNFEAEKTSALCTLNFYDVQCTPAKRRSPWETPRIGGNPKNQPISELDIFSKRQAFSRAVVVNSNMSRGKYLAREGPGLRLGPELLACRFKKKKERHARKSLFVEKRSFASQAVDPDFRPMVFANEESSPEPVICSLRLTLDLPASLSNFRENMIAFCQLEYFVSL